MEEESYGRLLHCDMHFIQHENKMWLKLTVSFPVEIIGYKYLNTYVSLSLCVLIYFLISSDNRVMLLKETNCSRGKDLQTT